MKTKKDLPSLGKRITTFSKAMIRAAKFKITGHDVLCEEEEVNERLEICNSCEEMIPEDEPLCAECGCDLIYKAQLASEFCPLLKWEENHPEKKEFAKQQLGK